MTRDSNLLSPDDTAEHHLVGTVNLRFIYLGMIGEVSRPMARDRRTPAADPDLA